MGFIQMYVDVDGDDDDELIEDNFVTNQGDKSFTDNSNISVDGDLYRSFKNVNRDLNEPADGYEDWLNQRNLQPKNYFHMKCLETLLNLASLTMLRREQISLDQNVSLLKKDQTIPFIMQFFTLLSSNLAVRKILLQTKTKLNS